MNPSQILKRYLQTQNVGSATRVSKKSNVVPVSQKIGYPTQSQKHFTNNIVDSHSVINHPLHTSHDKTKALKRRNKEFLKINNTGNDEYIDTNLGSTDNKAIIDEINNLIDKVLSNIETGSFYYNVVADMYSLLALFKRNIYKFDSYTLHDYKNYLADMFDVMGNNYHLIVGVDRQTLNLTELISTIKIQIDELILLMEENQDKSPYERKLILNNKLASKKFKKTNLTYVETLKRDLQDLEDEKMREKGGKRKQAQDQIDLLKQLITAIHYSHVINRLPEPQLPVRAPAPISASTAYTASTGLTPTAPPPATPTFGLMAPALSTGRASASPTTPGSTDSTGIFGNFAQYFPTSMNTLFSRKGVPDHLPKLDEVPNDELGGVGGDGMDDLNFESLVSRPYTGTPLPLPSLAETPQRRLFDTGTGTGTGIGMGQGAGAGAGAGAGTGTGAVTGLGTGRDESFASPVAADAEASNAYSQYNNVMEQIRKKAISYIKNLKITDLRMAVPTTAAKQATFLDKYKKDIQSVLVKGRSAESHAITKTFIFYKNVQTLKIGESRTIVYRMKLDGSIIPADADDLYNLHGNATNSLAKKIDLRISPSATPIKKFVQIVDRLVELLQDATVSDASTVL